MIIPIVHVIKLSSEKLVTKQLIKLMLRLLFQHRSTQLQILLFLYKLFSYSWNFYLQFSAFSVNEGGNKRKDFRLKMEGLSISQDYISLSQMRQLSSHRYRRFIYGDRIKDRDVLHQEASKKRKSLILTWHPPAKIAQQMHP